MGESHSILGAEATFGPMWLEIQDVCDIAHAEAESRLNLNGQHDMLSQVLFSAPSA
jgi:hypothetical protein